MDYKSESRAIELIRTKFCHIAPAAREYSTVQKQTHRPSLAFVVGSSRHVRRRRRREGHIKEEEEEE